MFAADKLSKRYLYGDEALTDVSFSLIEGEQAAFLGACAAGKTTLFKIIAGITAPDSGSVYIDNRDVTALIPKRRGVRMVFEDEGFFRRRSVGYNLKLPLKIRKYTGSETAERVRYAADRYSLSALKDEFVFRLSDADRIRMCLARLALCSEPLTLIDNVFSCMTGKERADLFSQLLPYIKADVSTALFATDSVSEAFSFSDKIFFLDNGRIKESGSPRHYVSDPQSLAADKYVNCERNFAIYPVQNDGETVFEAEGKTFFVDTESEYVIASYNAVPDECGKPASKPVRLYNDLGVTYYRTEDGVNIVSDAMPSAYRIDFSSMRVFDLITENRLTFAIGK